METGLTTADFVEGVTAFLPDYNKAAEKAWMNPYRLYLFKWCDGTLWTVWTDRGRGIFVESLKRR